MLAAAKDVVLEPSSDWTLTETPQSCAVTREFENDGRKVVLQIENHTLGPLLKMVVVTGDYQLAKAKLGRSGLSTGFLPGKTFDWRTWPASLPDGRQGVSFPYAFALQVNEDQLKAVEGDNADENMLQRLFSLARQRERDVDRLYVGNAFTRDIVLHTGSMRAPMVVMRSCLAGLARQYGLDWAKLDGASQLARPLDMAGWVQRVQLSYPPEMKKKAIGAHFDLVITVEPNGVARACEVFGKAPAPEFVDAACSVAYTEPFAPALDAGGEPIRGVYSIGVTYVADGQPRRQWGGGDYRPNLEPRVTGGESLPTAN
ncbi:hypothetical protein GRI89_01335 [Altererythrobacter salegens]|uniref:TonB C-terminal domain-containing protein n=1 Tax=Croceibacterium salegens TaxID=1737568 RepID=A0A6I4SS64_9SPHN|nr:energy transducer TonB [Croceibacterium salegens]MXO58188.1 hypothetical protein [Croceibacterium salegens]